MSMFEAAIVKDYNRTPDSHGPGSPITCVQQGGDGATSQIAPGAVAPVGWFQLHNGVHMQVAAEFAGADGTYPLYASPIDQSG